jgi:hypothetical protein
MKFLKKIFRFFAIKKVKKNNSSFQNLKNQTKDLKIKIKKTVYPYEGYDVQDNLKRLREDKVLKYKNTALKYWEGLSVEEIKNIKIHYNVKIPTNHLKILYYLENVVLKKK